MKSLPLIALLFIISCTSKPTAEVATLPTAQTITIQNSDATTDQDYTATLEGKTNVEIRPQVSGILDKVYVDEGAYVKAGQPLFKINDRPFREAVTNADANLNAAEATIQNAQIEIDRLTPLVANKVISDVQLRAAQSSYAVAKANAARARAMLADARISLGYTTITAPVNGYIGRLPKKQGSLVAATDPDPLTLLSDVHEIFAYFSLSENDFIKFKNDYEGNTLEEKLKNLPAVSLVLADNSVYQEEGKIDMVDGQFDKQTGAITLRAVFPNQNGLIRSGNTGKIRLYQNHSNSLLIPQASTLEVQDKVFVFKVSKDNKLTKQAIQILGKSGDYYLVSDGVQSGDMIVYNGLDKLQDGSTIKPEPVKAATAEKLSLK
ncbi:efflux RND transporter periplasmic adaptor subunit [Taibaiella lutea]|uniref:Efflux RND transporter periplasmic adaptor subunit n=1 Tax=Taibaiella lutea TaxID=2608001 RepID=A0A5M6CB16_9BACT|nr:efflux RND transporter periplasmic adaptor subunit [Taibaiella lutea]KAA5532378.1 efflux RND transporter periplasmic adaptor subunit [Taibaiella lutea]